MEKTEKKPNIIMILADDQGPWAMHCAGTPELYTPNLDRIAEQGMRFDSFFCASPVCSPARASILTGKMPSAHGVQDWLRSGNLDGEKFAAQGKENPYFEGYKQERKPISYLEGQPTYTDILAQNGYHCALSGKWHLGNSIEPQQGFQEWYTIGMGGCCYYHPDMVDHGEITVHHGEYVTDLITDRALEYLKELGEGDAPFYLSVHYTAPHSPWEKEHHPAKWIDYYDGCTFPSIPNVPDHPDLRTGAVYGTGKREENLRGYFAAISAMDEQIGRLLDAVEEQGLADNTVILFTADNGMSMGQHGVWGKGNGTFPMNMYDSAVKVPFLISWPGPALSQMPAEALAAMKDQVGEKIDKMQESIITQAGVSYVRVEYEAMGEDVDAIQMDYMKSTGIRMVLMALVTMMAAVCVVFLSSRVAASMGHDLRGLVYNKVIGFSSREYHKFSTASLITRCTNDIQQIQQVMAMMFRIVLYAPILGIGGVIRVLQRDSSMTWILGVAIVLIMAFMAMLFRIAMPKFTALQTMVDKLNLVTREILTGIPVIRAFSREKHEEERFEDANITLTKTNLFVNRCMTFMMPVMMLIMNAVSVLTIYSGSYAVDSGSMQVGDVMAFIQYAMQIIMSFLMITAMSIMLPRANVSARRINEVLETEVSVQDPEDPVQPSQDVKGTVEFDHVSFAYPEAGENVITDISFKAEKGETVAIIGSTGSGKSTLINLIPRFYDATEGSVKVDGVDVRKMTQKDVRDRIGYVPQKGVLFSGTIDSNIRYGKTEISEDAVKKAAEVAQATEFIDTKPERYKTPIAQGGSNVSGGQKQRLSIARAIAKDPEIFIFDDSFSALDFKTDSTLRKALKEHTKEATTIIVAQRISTILNADKILVLDDGHMAGIGSHKELMKSCEVYRQIAMSQLSEEELA